MQLYTSSDLIDEVHRGGYDWLTSESLRVLVHRKQFPEARHGSGTKTDPKRWADADLLRLLDRCFLSEQNNRARSIDLGLWLHFHEIHGVNQLLVDQIEEMQRLIMGRTLMPGDSLEETEFEMVNDEINKSLQESTVLSDLVRGEYPGFHSVDWEEYEETTGLPAETLKNFPYPKFDPKAGGSVIYPSDRIPASERKHLEMDAVFQRLNDVLGLEAADELSADEPIETARQWSLPALIELLQAASPAQLEAARWSAAHDIQLILEDFNTSSPIAPAYAAIDVRALLAEHKKDFRHVFGSSHLFPLMTLLIATALFDFTPSARVTRNLNLLALGMKHLLKRPQQRARKRDAVLILICAFHPNYAPDPRATGALKSHMKQLRKEYRERTATNDGSGPKA